MLVNDAGVKAIPLASSAAKTCKEPAIRTTMTRIIGTQPIRHVNVKTNQLIESHS